MEILRKENFSWIGEDKLALFFKLCIEGYLNETSSARSEFTECPLSLFCDCFNSVISLSKEICLYMKSKEVEKSLDWMKDETRNEILTFIHERKSLFWGVYKHEKLKELHHLTDFDYNVKLSLSSNRLLELNEPLLGLFLHTKLPKETNTKAFHFEMRTEELHRLIFHLREAHRLMERLAKE